MLEHVVIPKWWFALIQYGLALSVSIWLISRVVWFYVMVCFYLRAFRCNPWKIAIALIGKANTVCNSKYTVHDGLSEFTNSILEPNPRAIGRQHSTSSRVIRITVFLLFLGLLFLLLSAVVVGE